MSTPTDELSPAPGSAPILEGPLEKALHIEEQYHLPNEELHLRVRRQDEPSAAVNVSLSRRDEHQPGEWTVRNITPHHDNWADKLSPSGYGAMRGKFGPGHMRELASHLKERYGIQTLTGYRVTGMRARAGRPGDATVALTKAQADEPPYYFHLEHEKQHALGLHEKRFRIVDNTRGHRVEVQLHRYEEDPEGRWKVRDVTPIDRAGSDAYDRRHANQIGPATIRAFVRHLQQEHGVTSLVGNRVTGARHPGHGPDGAEQGVRVERPLTKSRATFRTLDALWGDDEPGRQNLSVEMMHPNQQQGAVVHLWRHDTMEPGHYHLADVEPIDHTLSISGKAYSRNFSNRLGPSVLRQAARYLKDTHGVTKVTGFRVTGARFPGHGEDGAEEGTPVETTFKALPGEPTTTLKLRSSVHVERPVGGRTPVAPDDWHHEGTLQNPLNDAKRVVRAGDAMGTYRVRNHAYLANHATVEEVQAVTRGGGRAAMQHLIDRADRHGVSLSLYANPLKPQGEGKKLSTRELKGWYRSFGFRPQKGDLMTRPPARDVQKSWTEGDADAWKGKAPPRLTITEDPSSHHEVSTWTGGKTHNFLFDVHDRTMEGVAGRLIVSRETIGKTPVYRVSHLPRGSVNEQKAHAEQHGPITPGDLLHVVRTLRQHFPDMKFVDRSYETRPKAGPRRQVASVEALHDMMAVGASHREQLKLKDEKKQATQEITKQPGAMTPFLRELPDTRKSLTGSPITLTKVNEHTFGEGAEASTYHEYEFTHKDHPNTPFFLGTYTHASKPHHLEIETVEPRDEPGLHVHMHEKYANVLGASGMRHVFRALQAHHPETKTVAFDRLTGVRQKADAVRHVEKPVKLIKSGLFAGLYASLAKAAVIVDPMPLKKLGTLFDYGSLGKDVVAKPQSQIERLPVTTSTSAANYDMTVDQTTRRLKGKANQKRLDEGMAHHGHLWYHMDPLHNAFKERHGEEEGSKRFNLFMNTIAATSPNSEFSKNMKRAGALFPFMVHGDKKHVLSADEGINHLLSQGKGGTGNTAHRNYAVALQNIRDGKPFLFSKPLKADGFAENLKGNFNPLTADRHFLRQAGHHAGTANPTDYQGVEDATAAHAANLATQGLLPVHGGRSATAPYQSALWIGDALHGRVKSPPHPALAVFEHEIHNTARELNIHPKEALNRFLDGHLHEFGGGAPGLTALLKQDTVRKSLSALRSVLLEIPLMKSSYGELDWQDVDFEPEPEYTHMRHVSIAPLKTYKPTGQDPRTAHTFSVKSPRGHEAELYLEHDPREDKPGQFYVQIHSKKDQARNKMGPAAMRQVASYLREEHGVQTVVAGREYKTGEFKGVKRDITKSLDDVRGVFLRMKDRVVGGPKTSTGYTLDPDRSPLKVGPKYSFPRVLDPSGKEVGHGVGVTGGSDAGGLLMSSAKVDQQTRSEIQTLLDRRFPRSKPPKGSERVKVPRTPRSREAEIRKAQFFQRLVQWIGGSQPSGKQGGEDGRMTTTMTRDGKVSRITSGAVKLSQVPNAKKGKLRREVTIHDAEDVKNAKDTDTAKYTPMKDGKVARIQFFVKSLRRFRRSLS